MCAREREGGGGGGRVNVTYMHNKQFVVQIIVKGTVTGNVQIMYRNRTRPKADVLQHNCVSSTVCVHPHAEINNLIIIGHPQKPSYLKDTQHDYWSSKVSGLPHHTAIARLAPKEQ